MIFLHSSFRTASTHFWSCFRQSPQVVAYYEVFHEALNTLTPSTIMSAKPDGWQSKHPDGAPYFLEYLPLMRDSGGIQHFDASFSYERFIPAAGCAGALSTVELDYLHNMIAHTENRGKTPVLTATRSLGRAPGLKQAFPGLHILIYRNLFQQWCSFSDQAFRGNPYFLDRLLDIIRLHQSDPVLRRLLTMFPVERPSEKDVNTFCIFVFSHLYFYTQSFAAMDLVVDVNQIEEDRHHRKHVEDRIAAEGIALDLSGTKNNILYSVCDTGPPASFADRMQLIGTTVIDQAPTEEGRTFGAKVLSDLIEEHARHTFQVKGLRSVLLGPGGLLDDRAALRAERDAALAELAALKAERATP